MTVGDPQFNRQQDQSNASIVSLGGGGMRANNYLLDGVPITELVGRAVLNPTIEAVEEVKVQVHTYDAEMGRTGGGVFNVDGQVGHQQLPRHRLLPDASGVGQSARTSSSTKQGLTKEESGPGRHLLPHCTAAASAARSGRTGRSSGPRPKAIDRRRRRNEQQIWPSLKQRAGDFSTSTIGGAPVSILQPVVPRRSRERQVSGDRNGIARNRRPVHRRASSRGRTRPRTRRASASSARGRPETIAGPIAANENNHPNAIATGPIVDTADMFTHQGRAQVHRQVVAERLLHLQQDRRAGQHDHEAGRTGTSPARTTSSARCAGGRTCWCSTTRTSSTTRRS